MTRTSATTSMIGPAVRVGVVGVFLFASGLSAPATTSSDHPIYVFERTAAVPSNQIESIQVETSASAVMEIRRRSGLTWQELSEMFNVSRRSIHHWASGKDVSAGNARFIRQILFTIRHLDRGESSRTRDLLFSPDANGVTAFELLKVGHFSEAMSRAEEMLARPSSNMPLSRAAKEARTPSQPALLLGAIQDRPVAPTKTRVARGVRVPKATG